MSNIPGSNQSRCPERFSKKYSLNNISKSTPQRALGLAMHTSIGTREEKALHLAASRVIHDSCVKHLDAWWWIGAAAVC